MDAFTYANRLRKEDYEVRDADFSEARAFIAEHHYARGGSNTCVYCHGLFAKGGTELLGVAWWLPPTRVAAESVNKAQWQKVLSLTRLAIVPGCPKNAASFLLARSVKRIQADGRFVSLVTYADESQGHLGGIYKASNWTYVGRTGPYPRWLDPETGRQVAPKATTNRTKAQMEALGYVKEGSFHKHKFLRHLSPIPCAKNVERDEKIRSTKHDKPFTFTPTTNEADMFRIEITAGSPLELAEAIRALSPIAFAEGALAAPTPLTIDADPAPVPQAVEQVTATAEVKTRKPRAKKDDTTANPETASAAPSVESVEKSDGVQLDIEDAIAGKSADDKVEEVAAAETAPAAGEPSDEPFTMPRAELKDWLIRTYLMDCIPEQKDRPAAFKALCEENGFKNFTETPDDKLPALKALADAKIKQFKDGGK